MGRFILLRCKQLLRLLIWALAAALLLGLCATAAGSALIRQNTEGVAQQKYRVALCGTTEDPLLQLGVMALQNLDETRFSVELLAMEEDDALQALKDGSLNGYVIVPEGFLQSALGGVVPTLRYVTAPSGTAVAKLFESEITQVIGSILLTAQKGSYGGYFALYDNGGEDQALTVLNELCLEYVELALFRSGMYQLKMLGVGSGLELEEYLTCAFSVVLCWLMVLPFMPMLVQRDLSLNRMLAAKGCCAAVQAAVDFGCLAVGLSVAMGVIFLLAGIAGISFCVKWSHVLPVVFLAAAMGYLISCGAKDLISGVCLHFLVSVAMCFLAGCLYPVYFLPMTLQRLAAWLPAGLCREYLAGCVTGVGSWTAWGMLLYGSVFIALALWIRSQRVVQAKGAA